MVDAAKRTRALDVDAASARSLSEKAHALLGLDGGNTLMFSLHIAQRVERRVDKHNPSGKERQLIDAALRSWSEEFSAAVGCLAEATPEALERAKRHANSAVDDAKAASAAGHRAGIYKIEPRPVIHYETTEEDMLLAHAADWDTTEVMLREEARLRAAFEQPRDS